MIFSPEQVMWKTSFAFANDVSDINPTDLCHIAPCLHGISRHRHIAFCKAKYIAKTNNLEAVAVCLYPKKKRKLY